MTDWREDLLSAILDCEHADLYSLSGCRYNMEEIVKECLMRFDTLDINCLVRVMFEYGLKDIEIAIFDRVCEIEAVRHERDLDEDEESELEALESLDPFEDIQSSGAQIWVDDSGKREIYNNYLQDALGHFKKMTGFDIPC